MIEHLKRRTFAIISHPDRRSPDKLGVVGKRGIYIAFDVINRNAHESLIVRLSPGFAH